VTRLVIDASALLSGIVGTDPSPPARLVDALFDGQRPHPALLPQTHRSGRCRARGARDRTREHPTARPREPASVVRDPNDDYLVALALAANARAIVTGDRDLLDHPGLNPPALTVRAACELLDI
jgi:predicted nucleic acid-binding protein